MAFDSVQLFREEHFSEWFTEFLKKELAPYPGRAALVTRVVISATVTMVLIVTFHIPGAVVGTLSAFFLSRENLVSTTRSVVFVIGAFLLGALFIPIGAPLFASTPETHFLWVASNLFLTFFLLRCLANYGLAVNLGLVIGSVVGIWYLPGPAERNVELTLWLILATLIGALVTLCVEMVFYAMYGRDDLVEGLDSRLRLIEDLMASYAKREPISTATRAGLARFAMVGSGALRRSVARGSYVRIYRLRMSTLSALVSRSVDFAAALAGAYPSLPAGLERRASRLNSSLEDIRRCLRSHGRPCGVKVQPAASPATPLFSEIESMVSLMPLIFSEEHFQDPSADPPEEERGSLRVLVPDAFTNPEHLRYIVGGTVAAMLCYVIYVALDWPNLSTSITTCVLTALTSIGASRQKQILRISGFTLGGVFAGMGSQIFILPNLDSIGGFIILFAIVTAIAAWISTSSSRLSYAGVQFAFAFYLVQLSNFAIQTDLSVIRDRALGVLLGITMMWIVFERLFPRSAADEMVRLFVQNLRALAALFSFTPKQNAAASSSWLRRTREEINRRFGEVHAQADAVPFETGVLRRGDMAARDRIRRWQAVLRTVYLLDAPLLQFRVFGQTSAKSSAFAAVESEFRSACSGMFLQAAESLEDQTRTRTFRPSSTISLSQRVEAELVSQGSALSEREGALVRLIRSITHLVDQLQDDVSSEGLYGIAPAVRPQEAGWEDT